jgi:hypothetical protein
MAGSRSPRGDNQLALVQHLAQHAIAPDDAEP